MSEISDLPLAVYARREPGAMITAEIEGATDGQPALVVRFRVLSRRRRLRRARARPC